MKTDSCSCEHHRSPGRGPVPSMRTPVCTIIRAAGGVDSRSGKNENTFEGNEPDRPPPQYEKLKMDPEIVLS